MTIPLEEEDEGPALAVENENPETIFMTRSNSEFLHDAIAELPLHYREALLLCEVEEMSYQEIAEALSVPIGTVMSRLSRARRSLREYLQHKMQGGKRVPVLEKGANHGL
jgi:RNA polymerase sigma-70 factor (ECF subfamily)